MRWKTFAIGWTLALAVLLFAQRRSPLPQSSMFSRVVDLTYTAPQVPVPHPIECEQNRRSQKSPYQAQNDCSTEPSETRVNLPAREILGQWSADQIPPERLIAPLVVIDVTEEEARNPAYPVSVDDIAKWESRYGHVPPGAVVIAKTRPNFVNSQRGQTAVTDTKVGAVAPGFTIDAARFLVEAREVYGLGIDMPSLDSSATRGFPVRAYIASRRVYGIENVVNLNAVPEAGGFVVVAPSKNATGLTAPARVLALAH